ncbi:MAG: RNA 2',3'-cyclic phosphodiesterase [Planctomycetota bacterium]
MRCFLALSPDPDATARIAAMLERLGRMRGRVRWVEPAQVHLTLQFLGEVAEDALPDLVAALGMLPPRAPLALSLDGTGRFPPRGAARVLWLGLGGELDRLQALVDDVAACCEAVGFPRERRPFRPHMTLGRVKGPEGLDRIVGELERLGRELGPGLTPIDRVRLLESRLGPSGARYTEVAAFPLAGTG